MNLRYRARVGVCVCTRARFELCVCAIIYHKPPSKPTSDLSFCSSTSRFYFLPFAFFLFLPSTSIPCLLFHHRSTPLYSHPGRLQSSLTSNDQSFTLISTSDRNANSYLPHEDVIHPSVHLNASKPLSMHP